MIELGTYQRQASQTAIGGSDPKRGIGEKSCARGTRFLHSPANTFPFIGPRKLLSSFKGQLLGTKITWPNKRESVGRRVQEASAPSIALGENSEEALRTSDRRERKRRADIKYRVIKKKQQQELEVENHRLKQEIQEKEKQEQLTKSELEELKAKHVRLKSELEEKNQVTLWEWIFVVSNLTLELPSAVFDQLSSPHKPFYALMAMALSLLAFVLCVSELLYKGLKEGITFQCRKGTIPWFYYPSRSHKRFGTFADIIGLVFAISQCIVTAINYAYARRAANSPIKFSLWPIIFALGLLCSRILKTLQKKASK